MRSVALVVGIAVAAVAWGSAGSVSRVLGSIDIASGQTAGDVSTVNGGIDIGDRAQVGAVSTVNGHIKLAAGAHAASVTTVNGSLTFATDAQVTGNATTVNGSMHLEKGVEIGGNLTNVNGDAKIDGAHIGGVLKTHSGSIDVSHGARIDGGIRVEDSSNNWSLFGHSVPRVVIGPGVTIGGPMHFDQKVELFVSDHAVIKGPIEGATATTFVGEMAPK